MAEPIMPIIPPGLQDQTLLYFFKKVNTDSNFRDYFFLYPVEMLSKLGIEFPDEHKNELRALVKRFNAHPPTGAKSVIYPSSEMYQMIVLLNEGKIPTGNDDLLIT